ncbi:cell envelope biogenesis protein OmpA [Polaribacter reichenbachii]|uniref:Cell envelope biogenesis protein OmpA n=1 Tax=Polaribacter reichenbachii TaxID=996801 RepID=A0A1B8U4U3_9FLAO|nr:OmpA family protein [Polaribacter reichenbachii]APZ47955.1 cell envelope biogenesis protein OmpA [Polaribacter reichenbachii]AUC18590.1 cell envelope biogenesis protein OmpA [Polaribacter reichenbachii]OBY66883.1 cell envelope biogenesis protein OmpA [Polaribacter reichenbachii]
MKKKLLSIVLLLVAAFVYGQDLPENPEPGKCYVRCKTPDIWKNETVQVAVAPEYKKIITYPAEYKTIQEKVLIKEAGQEILIVPAVWGSQEVTYFEKEDASKLEAQKAVFVQGFETVEIKAASASWQMSEKLPNCNSDNPDDCRYWCYKPLPAEFKTMPVEKLQSDASVVEIPIPGIRKTYQRKVMVKPPTTSIVKTEPVYKTIEKTVLVSDARKEEIIVPAVYRSITKEILVKKGGLTSWKAVDCELVDNTPLPINWDFSSAVLNEGAKRIIDARLLPILKQGMAVFIESHTDMRGTKSDNQALSDRRAKAVTDYLISKGINLSQLYAKGFGESRLLNKCSDGVVCSENEHAVNRRTTFRVVNQN